MTDLTDTIVPKSDQLNADDLIGGPRTIAVTGVKRADSPEQPIAISFDGDNGKPYRPCKSMRRVLVMVWGADGAAYVGRRMTLFRDPGVQFGGQQVGGIRISHMSHIDKAVTMALTATRANRKPFTVKPLAHERPQRPNETPSLTPQQQKIADGIRELIARLEPVRVHSELESVTTADDFVARRNWIKKNWPDKSGELEDAIKAALARIEAQDSEGVPSLVDDGILPDGWDVGAEDDPTRARAESLATEVSRYASEEAVKDFAKRADVRKLMTEWKASRPELFQLVEDATEARMAALAIEGVAA